MPANVARALRIYVTLEPRSLNALAIACRARGIKGASLPTLKRWSAQYGWQQLAARHDQAMAASIAAVYQKERGRQVRPDLEARSVHNTNGVKVGVGAVALADTVIAHRNRLTDTTSFGVNNLSTWNAIATRNWWGASNGPGPIATGSGDRVTANVTYEPFLHEPRGTSCGEGNDISGDDS